MLFPVEHHTGDLIQSADGRERDEGAEKPFESTHGNHTLL